MLSIDEAIEHARAVAETCEVEASKYDISDSYEREVAYKEGKCAEEHEQLVEWLEELKAYREIGTVEECKNSVLDIQKAYNKAIDDMVGNLIANSRTEIIDGKITLIVTEERIKTVSNKMKNG